MGKRKQICGLFWSLSELKLGSHVNSMGTFVAAHPCHNLWFRNMAGPETQVETAANCRHEGKNQCSTVRSPTWVWNNSGKGSMHLIQRSGLSDSLSPAKFYVCSLEELSQLEYCPVHVQGQFDHSRELYIGPRTLLIDGDAASQAGLTSQKAGVQSGYLVVTPFHLADRE